MTFRRQRVESRILSPHECEVALLLHNGAAAPVAGLRCAVLQQRCLRVESAGVCLGFHHEVVRNASIVIKTGLARVPDFCTNGHSDTLSHETH